MDEPPPWGRLPLQEKKMKKVEIARKGKKLTKEVETGGRIVHRESLCFVLLLNIRP